MGILTRDDWSLDRRGQRAQERHRQKVREALRKNLADAITDEGIIVSDGRRTIRIPVHSLDQPHFIYDYRKQRHVGQGEGKPGQPIGRLPGAGDAAGGGSGAGSGAGDKPGERALEAEVTLEDIEEVLFEDLCLPNLRTKQQSAEVVNDVEFTDIRNKGVRANIDRRRTLLEALRRSRLAGRRLAIREDDLRFKTWEDSLRPATGAVVIAMMDVSGSMGLQEKYLARTFFFWMERFLRSQYQSVAIRYLVHHVEAYETTKEQFYSIRESGGTLCSSVFRLALDLIQREYPTDAWNVYPVYVGDGDNLAHDNELAARLMGELADQSALAGYVEVQRFYHPLTLMAALRGLNQPNLRLCTVSDRGHILNALRTFFREEEAV
ncbi:MAG: DUF444 family protein [Alicyclobacillaceae bacterium]|nr:DUF444 family protein [Alicyclobacillaceae bacterium]